MIPLLLMLAVNTSAPIPTMPASAFDSMLDMHINRGPTGDFPPGGCLELVLTLDGKGRAVDTRLTRSSGYRQIDRGVMLALGTYPFNMADLREGTPWRVFFSWSKDGQQTRLSNKCVDLG